VALWIPRAAGPMIRSRSPARPVVHGGAHRLRPASSKASRRSIERPPPRSDATPAAQERRRRDRSHRPPGTLRPDPSVRRLQRPAARRGRASRAPRRPTDRTLPPARRPEHPRLRPRLRVRISSRRSAPMTRSWSGGRALGTKAAGSSIIQTSCHIAPHRYVGELAMPGPWSHAPLARGAGSW